MRRGLLTLPLAVHLFAGAAALIVIGAAASAYFVMDYATRVYLADRGAASGYRAEHNARRISESIEGVRRDVLFLSRVPPVQGIIDAMGHGGVDSVEGRSIDFWKLRLQEIFAALAEARPQYYQLRYIGVVDDGAELVRFDSGTGTSIPESPAALSDEHDREHFHAALTLKEGEILLTDIELKREHNRIAVPHVPSLRAATPVFTRAGEPFGVVTISVNMGPVMDSATTGLPPGILAYIANSAGDYLAHPLPDRSFGFDLGRRHTWQQDMPALNVPEVAGGAGERSLQQVQGSQGFMHVAVERIPFDRADPRRFLVLAYALPHAFVQERLAGLRSTVLGVTVLLVLAIGMLVFLLLRRLLAPLAHLTAAAEGISHGRYDVALPEESAWEMGVFVRAFRTMLENIRQRDQDVQDSHRALRANEARLNTVVESLDEGVAVFDLEGNWLHFNRAALEMHEFDGGRGFPTELARLADMFELADADGNVLPEQAWPVVRILRGEILHEIEIRLRRKDREWHRTFTYGGALARDPEGRPLLAVVTIRDITQRKLIEAAVREGQERYRTLFNTLLEGFCIIEVLFDGDDHPVDYRFLEINSAFERQTGLHDARGKTMKELAPDHERHWFETFGRVALTGEPVRFVNEAHALNRWFDVSAYRIGGPENRQVAILFNDISELKQAEQRVRGQLEHLNLLDHITRAIGERQDLKSIFQVVVRSLEDSLPVDFGCVCLYEAAVEGLRITSIGVKSEELALDLSLDDGALIHVDQNGLARCVRGELVYEPDIGRVNFPFPARLARAGLGSMVLAPLRSESRIFGVLVAARRRTDGFSSIECEFLRQLSEHVALAAHHAQLYAALQQAYDDLRQTQQVVMQEERLRALGQMASGIAHDINNALSPVSLYTESMLETEKNLSDRARGYLQTILRAVQDVAQTVARMREFYRQRELQLELVPVDLNQMAQQVLELTKAHWSDQPLQNGIVIRALTELAPDLPRVMGVESEIREALTNLVFNAVDAMPGGGTLTLRTRLTGAEPGRTVIVDVTDTGIGMAEETRRRCLEPFYTTKGERGTGLGLAMVFGMVQRHSAELEIQSAPGSGTTMSLVFGAPTTNAGDPGGTAAVIKPPTRLRLLLVDDDPVLLKSLRDALELDGHVIVAVNGGEAGIGAFRAALERGEQFAAVITDLGMPYVDGRKVATAVKESSPATPVILLTGWGQRLLAEGDVPPHVDRVLPKPPRLRDLREALAHLCTGANP